MEKLTIYERVGYSVPKDCIKLLRKYGVKKKPKDEAEMIRMLAAVCRRYDDAKVDLIMIHPDRQKILAFGKYMNAEGEQPNKLAIDQKTLKTWGIGAGVVLGVVVLLKALE